jgi:hypothetical protein
VSLLADPVFDAFLTGSSPFSALPHVVQELADGSLDALCHVIEYPQDENSQESNPQNQSRKAAPEDQR